jgi:hypothetical protein
MRGNAIRGDAAWSISFVSTKRAARATRASSSRSTLRLVFVASLCEKERRFVMTPRDAIKFAREKRAKIVDLRFIDMPGLWQHFSIPVGELTQELFAEGIGFDGSSIRGFQSIDESDMLLMPDPSTAAMDPFTADPTLVLICDVRDPVTGQAYSRDPRYVAQKAERYVQKIGPGRHGLHRAGAGVLFLR